MRVRNFSFAAAFTTVLGSAATAWAANISPEGYGIIGVNTGINGEPGTPHTNAGAESAINDMNSDTRVDTWGIDDQNFSYVGVLWPDKREDALSAIHVTFATFPTGGWFGPAGVGPGDGGVLGTEPVNYLIEPVVQVTEDGGLTWTNVEFTSNYIAAMTGHGIGGGANPWATARTVTFTLTSPVTGKDGIRIIGENGGTASNGFVGVFEFEVESITSDSDGDGMDDDWEIANGLNVGVDDSGLDPDEDGLTNLQEFLLATNPGKADSDGDGLTDGAEVNVHFTNPLLADTDGDGLTDGAEVTIHNTDPKLADTDGDGLSDWQEIYAYATNPVVADTDNDGFSDGVEIRLRSNPLSAEQIPANLAPSGTAILGTSTGLNGGVETPHENAGVAANINDASYLTRVDTWGRTDPYAYAGVVWPAPLAQAVGRVEVSLAIFGDGGWFGANDSAPGYGSYLAHDPENPEASHVIEPVVQVTRDGTTWETVASVSNYLKVFDGQPTPGWNFSAPAAIFVLEEPQTGLSGIRLIGPEGGAASGGFIGIWEFAAIDASRTSSNIALEGSAIMGVAEEINDQPGTLYWQSGTPVNINDENYDTRVDTWNGDPNNHPETFDYPASFAGILWPAPRTTPVDRIEATFLVFVSEGGWFGPNGVAPDGGETLSAPDYLAEPLVQVTTNGGRTWTTVPHSSTYLSALNGQPVTGVVPSATVIFALETPIAGIDGIRLIGNEGGRGSNGFLGLYELVVRDTDSLGDPNIAAYASGLIGINDAIDADDGRLFPHAGAARHVNDGNPDSRTDTWDGEPFEGEEVDLINYVGLRWPAARPVAVETLRLTLATFSTGGWFGRASTGPGAGGLLTGDTYLLEPTVQVTTDGVTWTSAAHTSDYLTAFEGHAIGGGGNPDPSRNTAVFTLTPPRTDVVGVRIIGEAGGTASLGFLGVFELEAESPTVIPSDQDSDGDGQTDAAELIAGTDPNDPHSVFRILNAARSDNQFVVEWSSVPGRTYQVQVSSNLGADGWAAAGDPTPAAAAPAATTSAAFALPAPAPAGLQYRVVVLQP